VIFGVLIWLYDKGTKEIPKNPLKGIIEGM
jgi:hypothetical protein